MRQPIKAALANTMHATAATWANYAIKLQFELLQAKPRTFVPASFSIDKSCTPYTIIFAGAIPRHAHARLVMLRFCLMADTRIKEDPGR